MTSCVNQQFIYESNKFYEIKQSINQGRISDSLFIHSPSSGFIATISDKGDYLIIKPHKLITYTTKKIEIKKPIIGWRADNVGKFYFPETVFDTSQSISLNLNYFEIKPVLQALTVPLKIRPSILPIDSLPSQAETGFNVGIAFGMKFTHNIYSSDKNLLGQNIDRFSISPGLFLGTGATDLKKSNTKPNISFERRAALITTGGFLILGFNNFNMGYALGYDFAIGQGSVDWLYQGKHWHGLIFSIDILK